MRDSRDAARRVLAAGVMNPVAVDEEVRGERTMKVVCHYRLALIFAFLACIIPPLDKVIAEAYPDPSPWSMHNIIRNSINRTNPPTEDNSENQSKKYIGYTPWERTRAGVSLLGFAFCLMGFFTGRAGLRGEHGRKRDFCMIATMISVCSGVMYAGILLSLILFLVLMLRLQRKTEVPVEQFHQTAADEAEGR